LGVSAIEPLLSGPAGPTFGSVGVVEGELTGSGLQAIAGKMKPLATTRGIHVAKQGSAAECLFFLQRGSIEVLHLGHPVARIMAPATFGEAALLRGEMESADKRLSGYRTATTCMCASRARAKGNFPVSADTRAPADT
jgi:hypothetical protein